jgi:uncharacterized protein YprB with RNaseH-like and TPR domain
MLQAADKVISFNGKQFDLLVLRRHHGLKGQVPARGDYHHIDLHQIMSKKAGCLMSLDRAVKINFGESKHTSGHEMAIWT